MSSAAPIVSIVTPSYNMAAFLPRTIESVLSQDYPHIDYIVADGASTDGTLSILGKYVSRLRYFSEKDKGPSDAINRGFRKAKGEILAWLNADDVYLPGAVRAGVEYLCAHPEVDVVYGEGYWINEHGEVLERYPSLPFDAKMLQRECFICQPASFFRADAYQKCGGLDPDVDPSFDFDLWIRMTRRGLHFAALPQYLAGSRVHSGAKTLREREKVFHSSMLLLKRHYGYVPLSWVYCFTAYRIDGRDQLLERLRPSARKYLASLPTGLRLNPTRRIQFFLEWLTTPSLAAKRHLLSTLRHSMLI